MSNQVKVYAGDETQRKWDKVRAQFTSNTSAFAVMVEKAYSLLSFSFNDACVELGITGQREAFSEWRQENDVPDFATLGEWENYARAFETDGAADDERNTQADALQ